MRAGALKHRVTLSRPSGTSGYADVESNVPASITFLPGGSPERLQFGVPAAFTGFLIRLRYRTDIRAEWRVVDELGRTFQISSYGDPEDKRRELQLLCTEIQ